MSWWLAMPALASGINALSNYANPVKRSLSEGETTYRNQLAKRAKHGVFDPSEKREIISDVSRTTGQASSKAKQEILGQTTRQGIENSSVVPQMMQNVEEDRMRRIAEASRKIALKNSMSKIEAQNKLGEIGFKDTERSYQMSKARRKAFEDVITSLGSAVGTVGSGEQLGEFKLSNILGKDGEIDIDKANKAMENMGVQELQDYKKMIMEEFPNVFSQMFSDEEEDE